MRRQSIRRHNPMLRGLGETPAVRPVFLWVLGGAVLVFLLSRTKTAQTAASKVAETVSSGAKKILTLNAIRNAMPKLPLARATDYLGPLVEALDEAEINTPARLSAFLAQVGHESGDFRYMEELASGDAYEGRCGTKAEQLAKYGKYNGSDLGNCQPGDGKRFKGRGPIQLTGRANYRALTKAIGAKYGVDFEKNPELLAQPKWGFKAAAWFWTTRNLNALADAGNFDQITYRINGGYNGKPDRDARYATAKAALVPVA